MKIKNVSGLAYHFFPGLLRDKLDATKVETAERIIGNNKIAFFTGTMPQSTDLYSKTNYDAFIAENQNKMVFKIDNLDFKYTYDSKKKERIIQKVPVDAINYQCLIGAEDGSQKITWCVIKLEPINPSVKDNLIFTNNIGTWNTPNIAIMFENLTCVAEQAVLLKDITISVRDVHELDV